ncbi:Gibberellin 2-beta-dioxygenase 2 [Glycine soja]|uniref:Gibberellin 2-beta-dioxygenase 2 n=1 Tax=Glycine soja TaxID=3848 RepID=A0A445GT73_GLYSO|nr:Gibberellin 2-beta-dioxygenase 2 [Glycine soja]
MVAASPISIRSEKISPIDLPMVDLTGERSMVKKLIVKACEEYGFFNVINHGVPRDTIAKMEEAAFDFFAKPMAQKKQVALYGCKNIGFNGDMGEVEYLLLSATPPSVAHLKNISNVPSNFSSSVSAYTEGVRELACEILELMAEGLGVPDTWFFSRLIREVDSDSVLRFNHYPPIILNKDCFKDNHNHTKVIGFGEHSDPQILTILRSNDVPGLQISLQDGVWNPVAPDPSAFCVNVGDLLQGAYFKNYLRIGVCFKTNDGGGLFLGVTRHCQWRQRWREAGIVTGSGDIGGERLGLADRDGEIGQGQSRR